VKKEINKAYKIAIYTNQEQKNLTQSQKELYWVIPRRWIFV